MTDTRTLLIRGSEKVMDHYHRLLSRAETEEERQLYRSRIEREQGLIDQLQAGLPSRVAA